MNAKSSSSFVKLSLFATVSMAAAVLSACGKQEAQVPASPAAQTAPEGQSMQDKDSMKGMPMPESSSPDSTMPQASASDVHSTHGNIRSMDQKARTVTIAHEPVASLNWPAMTMAFQVQDEAALSGLKEGDTVEFSFTAQPDNQYVITAIAPRH